MGVNAQNAWGGADCGRVVVVGLERGGEHPWNPTLIDLTVATKKTKSRVSKGQSTLSHLICYSLRYGTCERKKDGFGFLWPDVDGEARSSAQSQVRSVDRMSFLSSHGTESTYNNETDKSLRCARE